MSRGAKLTITGLYEYNPNIFTYFNVPSGMTKSEAINAIIMECGDLELLYPSYTFMEMAIKNWSAIEQNIWTKLWETETADYNPLWNVDATITETGNATGTGSTKGYNSSSWLDNDKTVTDDTRTIVRTGNIGVTSSQQLIAAEREVADFSTYKYIVESFKKRFCIMVY